MQSSVLDASTSSLLSKFTAHSFNLFWVLSSVNVISSL